MTATTCALCGLVYEPGGAECRSHGCPFSGGCRTEHCPRCGYTVPDEEGSVLARGLRRLLGRRPSPPPRTLAELPAGSDAVVGALEGEPALLAHLTAQGLCPGVELHLVQRIPSFVIEMGETTLALERRVAEAIRLR
jgi:DtxR family transcriptional regulator, Mn-dependent transcriptional regulator